MSTEHTTNVHPSVDDTVIAAIFVSGKPMAVSCLVTSQAPLYLFTKDKRVEHVATPCTSILVWHRGLDVVKGDAKLVSIEPWKTGYQLELKRTAWAEVDRRVYPRYPMQNRVVMKSVCDNVGATVFALFQGETVDVSLGGAWIKSEPTIELGQLVEFTMKTEEGDIHAFAMVAHKDENRGGIGITFLDFASGSREKLANYLEQIAKSA